MFTANSGRNQNEWNGMNENEQTERQPLAHFSSSRAHERKKKNATKQTKPMVKSVSYTRWLWCLTLVLLLLWFCWLCVLLYVSFAFTHGDCCLVYTNDGDWISNGALCLSKHNRLTHALDVFHVLEQHSFFYAFHKTGTVFVCAILIQLKENWDRVRKATTQIVLEWLQWLRCSHLSFASRLYGQSDKLVQRTYVMKRSSIEWDLFFFSFCGTNFSSWILKIVCVCLLHFFGWLCFALDMRRVYFHDTQQADFFFCLFVCVVLNLFMLDVLLVRLNCNKFTRFECFIAFFTWMNWYENHTTSRLKIFV